MQSNYNEIGFAFNTSLCLGGKDVPLPKNSDKIYEPPTNWSPIQVIWRICLYLEGVFAPEDLYRHLKIPQQLRLSNPAVSVKLISLAEEIEQLFGEQRRNKDH